MEYEIVTKKLLHMLGVTKLYYGYNYVVFGIHLLKLNEDYINCITKSMYIDIAKKYNTSWNCVERNIRKVIDVIWRNSLVNKRIIIEVFGEQYLYHKPTNRQFLEYLYNYTKFLNTRNCTKCPISGNRCVFYETVFVTNERSE